MDDEPVHERFLLSLAKFATAIVFDRRGIGLSDPMSAPTTIDGWVDQIVSVMDACGFDRAYLLAHLVGAVPSMTLAVNRPERVQGLILAMAVLHWGLPRAAAVHRRCHARRACSRGAGCRRHAVAAR